MFPVSDRQDHAEESEGDQSGADTLSEEETPSVLGERLRTQQQRGRTSRPEARPHNRTRQGPTAEWRVRSRSPHGRDESPDRPSRDRYRIPRTRSDRGGVSTWKLMLNVWPLDERPEVIIVITSSFRSQ